MDDEPKRSGGPGADVASSPATPAGAPASDPAADPTADPKRAIWGAQAERIEHDLRTLDPELGDLIVGTAYERVFADPDLDLRSRELIAVALLTAQGAGAELETHLRGALRAGSSPAELRAALRHAAMFVGFPRALAAMRTLAALEAKLAERGAGGSAEGPAPE